MSTAILQVQNAQQIVLQQVGTPGPSGSSSITSLRTMLRVTTSQTLPANTLDTFALVKSAGLTLTLPASPADGSRIVINDASQVWSFGSPCVVSPNGARIRNPNALSTTDATASVNLTLTGGSVAFIYCAPENLWTLE